MRRLNLILGVAVGLALLAVWARLVDLQHVWGYVAAVRWPWALLFCAVYPIGGALRSVRWRRLLRHAQATGPIETAAMYYAGNLVNFLIPLRAGEIAKAALLKRRRNTAVAVSAPSIVLDKMFDFGLVICLIGALSLSAGELVRPFQRAVLLGSGLGLALLALLIAARREPRIGHWLTRGLGRLRGPLSARFRDGLERSIEALRATPMSGRDLVWLTLLSGAAFLVDATSILLLFRALGVAAGLVTMLLGSALVTLSFALPAPPGQIGSNEMIWILVFSVGLGIGKEAVAAVAAFGHVLGGLVLLATGLAGLGYLSAVASGQAEAAEHGSRRPGSPGAPGANEGPV